ncbi:MAG: non-hydrolyzing UDP-N-acetylglucosamine 2-epimerase [Syntrophobacteraceae bacterium]
MPKVLSIFGTRPEAIKMAPVIKKLALFPGHLHSIVCVTAQHREMLDQVLSVFKICPDYDLDIMKPGQDLFDVTRGVLEGLKEVISEVKPQLVLVHGDTTTSMAASLAAFYCKTRVGHVEAGLRTRNKFAPFPEEMNRRLTGALTDFHFAPTQQARDNLIAEGVAPDTIYVTGNTVVDALLSARATIEEEPHLKERFETQFSFLNPDRKLILVTGHRRENFGQGFFNICQALATFAQSHPEVQILYPIHLNPNVQAPVRQILGNSLCTNVYLIDPVEYLSFVYLMNRAWLILTDSGGIQEEAPSLGKPVLVMRDATERPEGVEAGIIKVIGSGVNGIISSLSQLITDPGAYNSMISCDNPYGDGKAGERIAAIIHSILFLRD